MWLDSVMLMMIAILFFFCRTTFQTSDVSAWYGIVHGHVLDDSHIPFCLLMALQCLPSRWWSRYGAVRHQWLYEYEELYIHEGCSVRDMARWFLHCVDGMYTTMLCVSIKSPLTFQVCAYNGMHQVIALIPPGMIQPDIIDCIQYKRGCDI